MNKSSLPSCALTVLLIWVITPLLLPGHDRPPVNLQAVQGLIERIVPGKADAFVLEVIPGEQHGEGFELDGKDGKIILRGSSTLALSRALNWYLNTLCHTSVSWYREEAIDTPAQLPVVTERIHRVCRFDKRFFLNYCTFAYTTLWWQWPDWERLVDWMALNGINMPLAITGQEYVWQRVWRQFGLTDEEIRAFFSGPAHLPWHRMGNLDGWLGPLPQSFIDHQFKLQKQILQRERDFGMTPVLPAFSGHTPKILQKRYPKLKLSSLGSYDTGEEHDAFFMDPMEPLFVEIQKAFLKEQTSCFGSDHYYGADPFNEMNPPSWEPDYLASVSRTIYRGMAEVDPQAVWVQMGWTFYYDRKNWTNPRLQAMIQAVPENRMMLLDYYCEHTEIWRLTDGFFNAPYIWCYLGNFGGGTQMAGPLKKIARLLPVAEADGNRRKMQGIGSTLEGFGVNRFIFEWLFEYAWDENAADLDRWIRRYARSRTGHFDPVAEEAWLRLLDITYDQAVSGVGLGNAMQARPRFEGKTPYTRLGLYDYRTLADVFAQMLLADEQSLQNPRYRYDLVMVGRQVLVNLFNAVREDAFRAYKAEDIKKFDEHAALLLEIAADVDRLVRCCPEFSLNHWIESAHRFDAPDTCPSYFEKNAKVLVTTWGPKGSLLTDYAARDFSGLINQYYRERWRLFLADVRTAMINKRPFDQAAFDVKLADFDWHFCEGTVGDETESRDQASDLARELYIKYVRSFSLLTNMSGPEQKKVP